MLSLQKKVSDTAALTSGLETKNYFGALANWASDIQIVLAQPPL